MIIMNAHVRIHIHAWYIEYEKWLQPSSNARARDGPKYDSNDDVDDNDDGVGRVES